MNRVCSQPCGPRALKNSCLQRERDAQKAPISVAQERQILDVPTLIPGPCVAAPKTGGAAYAGGTGTPAEAGEKRNVAIWLLLDEPSLSAPAGDGILGTAGTAVAEAAPRALLLDEPILLAKKLRRDGSISPGTRRRGAGRTAGLGYAREDAVKTSGAGAASLLGICTGLAAPCRKDHGQVWMGSRDVATGEGSISAT